MPCGRSLACAALFLVACGEASLASKGPRDAGDRGGKRDGAVVYDCSAPAWDDPDWLANSGCYYVVDVRELTFNNWCYRVSACTAGQPPAGKTVEELLDQHDRLAALASLQGLVNRDRATLYIIGEETPDTDWLRLLAEQDIWLTDMTRTDLATVEDALAFFGGHPAVAGSVSWRDTEPFTMNLAFSLAGADNLLVVREGSAFADVVTARFPLKEALGGRFATKRAGYEWLIETYLKTGKLAPEVALYTDGFAVARMKSGPFDHNTWALLPRDHLIARKQFFIGYGVHPASPDPLVPAAPAGEGRAVLDLVFAAIREREGPGALITSSGWPVPEYSFDCDGDQVITSSDHVGCEEWEWSRYLSQKGGVLRIGGAELYAKEAANGSFFRHGPGVDVLAQPAPLTPPQLLARGHAFGPPANFSFELGDAGWSLTSTNRVVYDQAAGAREGTHFLEVNVAPGDVGTGFHQDVVLPLPEGQLHRFLIHGRKATGGGAVSGRLRASAGPVTLCEKNFTLSSEEYVPLTCDFEVDAPGLSNPRLAVHIDTPNQSAAFDEAYLLGAVEVVPNLTRDYVLFYLGDYDALNPVLVGPVGVYPFVWTDGRTSAVPTAYSMAANISAEAPPIFAYFAKTKTANQTFVMPDSGAGYLNPGYLPDAVVPTWIEESARYHRPFGYRLGWVLNGHAWADVRTNNAAGTKIRNMYRALAPDGITYNGLAAEPRFVEGGLPVLPLLDSSFFAGASTENMANDLIASLTASPSPFNVYRCVFLSDSAVEAGVTLARTKGANFEVLDPSTFNYLFRQSQGLGTVGRLSVIAHAIPSRLTAGETVAVSVTVRNDGWDAWHTTPVSGVACDGSAIAGKGCERLAWGIGAGPVSPTGWGAQPTFPYGNRASFAAPVFPGETATLNFDLVAPAEAGTYTFQLDGVKELYRFFESSGNVPWQKQIRVQ